jgi:hypothetical protein
MKKTTNEKGITESRMVELLSVTQHETVVLLATHKNEMFALLSEQFALMFKQMDIAISDLRIELKQEIAELRKEMNQRFLMVDTRLTSLEKTMTPRYEHEALVRRVENLE